MGAHSSEVTDAKSAENGARILQSMTRVDHLIIAFQIFCKKHECEPLFLVKLYKSFQGDPQGYWVSAGADCGVLRSRYEFF